MSFSPPEARSDQPIFLPTTLRGKILAQFFRDSAVRIRNGDIPLNNDLHSKELFLRKHEFWVSCGERLIEADRAGLIPDTIPELRKLIEWHTQPMPPFAGRVQYVRGPSNLFHDVIGGNMIRVRSEPEGLRVITDVHGRPEPFGGLMHRIDSQHLKRSENERIAMTCQFLATVIEETAVSNSGKPPRNAQQRTRQRGPKQKYNPTADQEFAIAWEQAEGSGVVFKDFCEDRRISVKNGKRTLARVRSRKPRRKS
jgi:hypothetical protein